MSKDTSGLKSSGDERLLSQSSSIRGRFFIIELLKMHNGCFASVSEDESPRIGGITITVKTDRRTASTSSLIPERKGSLFASMLGELLAEKLGGLAVVSLYLKEEIDPDTMKTLINEVRKLVAKDLNPTP